MAFTRARVIACPAALPGLCARRRARRILPSPESTTLTSPPEEPNHGAGNRVPGSPPDSGEPPVYRGFYESVAARHLDVRTARGIEYRNRIVAGRVGARRVRVLEIGPGEGWLVQRLLARGHRVTTTDLSRNWLLRLPSAGDPGLLRVQANVFHLPFAAATFDRVVAAEVIEHLPDPGAALKEIRRVLTPNGSFIATVPYRETLSACLCPRCGGTFERNGHLNSFDEAKLRALFRESGFTPRHLFVGPTRLSREIWCRVPVPLLLGLLQTLDRLTIPAQRCVDTWMLLEGRSGA